MKNRILRKTAVGLLLLFLDGALLACGMGYTPPPREAAQTAQPQDAPHASEPAAAPAHVHDYDPATGLCRGCGESCPHNGGYDEDGRCRWNQGYRCRLGVSRRLRPSFYRRIASCRHTPFACDFRPGLTPPAPRLIQLNFGQRSSDPRLQGTPASGRQGTRAAGLKSPGVQGARASARQSARAPEHQGARAPRHHSRSPEHQNAVPL